MRRSSEMNIPGEPLTRVTKPLRCTSLHQTILASSPSANANSLSNDSPLMSAVNDSDDEADSESSDSSDNESTKSDMALDEPRNEGHEFLDLRRNSNTHDKRHRRASSGTSLKFKQKVLSLAYTSPSTTAHAINEVFTRRESFADTLNVSKSPEADRAHFLAELPDAIARARKVHYRRDALLPKTKSFNRVQNSLKEDSAPFETDVKKEATLAKILQSKNAGEAGDVGIDELHQAMSGSSDKSVTTLGAPLMLHQERKTMSTDAIKHPVLTPSNLFDREEPLFTMEDVPTSSSKTSGHSSGSTRTGRSAKRKNDEAGRYEPYAMSSTGTHKRRAISPSPASPLASPNVKGSIFRIENLTL